MLNYDEVEMTNAIESRRGDTMHGVKLIYFYENEIFSQFAINLM